MGYENTSVIQCLIIQIYLSAGRNALQVLMCSARLLQAPSLPNRISEVTNRKHKLYSDIITYLEERQLMWKKEEVTGVGETLVKTLVDTMWYIDGHHHVLKNRSNKIPESLEQFTGYNVPEVSKHRKRTLQNLSECTLRQLSNRLFTCLQATHWERSGWESLKSVIQALATSISDYAAYLREQNKKMKHLQSLPQPVRSIADNLVLQFLPQCETMAAVLIELDSCLQEKNDFEYIVVEDVCPLDPHHKYEYLQALKSSGLAMHAVILTYTHGNSIGNSHFVWKIPEQSPDAFSESQHTIEKMIKENIPMFHTRAM